MLSPFFPVREQPEHTLISRRGDSSDVVPRLGLGGELVKFDHIYLAVGSFTHEVADSHTIPVQMSIPIAESVDYKGRDNPTEGPVATLVGKNDPTIERSVTLRCVGDWGHANFHRIMSFITQEFTERCGPTSRTCI